MLLCRKIPELEDQPQMSSSSLSAVVRRGALWSIASAATLKLANIFITAFIAHILDPRDFGIYAVALTAYGIIAALGEFGLGSCIGRADLDVDSLAPTMTTVAFTTNAIQAGVMVTFAEPIAAALGSAAAAGPIRVLALAMFITGIFTVPAAQLGRDFKQNKLFLANLVGFLVSTPILILFAISGSGPMAFAWSMVVSASVSGCVMFASVSRHYRLGLSRNALNVLFRFGFPLGGANIVNYVLLNGDYAVVGHVAGAVTLGAYVLAFNVASWPSSLLGFMINGVSIPAFSRLKDDADRLKHAISRALSAISLLIMPMSALTIALARPLVLTLYGDKWTASIQPLAILASYGAVSIICVLFANILASQGRAYFVLIVQLVWLLALVPTMVLGVHRNGIVGASVAHVIVIVPIVLPIYLFGLRKIADLAKLARAALPALVAASAAAVAAASMASVFTNPLVQLITGLVVGGLTYMVIALPYAMTLLSQEQIIKLHMARILDLYSTGARLIRLPAGGGPKHTDASDGEQSRQGPKQAIGYHPAERATGSEWWQNAAAMVARYPAGLADAYDQYAVPLYGYCQWMLKESAGASDAMEHAFVAAVTELDDLGDPGKMRSWLYMKARDECYHLLSATGRFRPTDADSQPADFSSDAKEAEARRLIRATMSGLNLPEREVVELSLRHNLNDADLAMVLGMSWSEAHALSSRARSQLENALRFLLVAHTGRGACRWLDELLAGWDGQLTTRMRDLINLHVEQCQACAGYRRRSLRPEALFSLLPAAVPPAALRERILERCASITRDRSIYRQQMTQPLELLQDNWFPGGPGLARSDKGRGHRKPLRS
jgi:lipopolysaccharide exporter